MVVAVAVVRVVQMRTDEEIDVVTVRHSFVAAAYRVNVSDIVFIASVAGCTPGGITATNGETVLIDVTFVRVVEMTIV